MESTRTLPKETSPLLDITERVPAFGRDECVLWPNQKRPESPKYPAFGGTVRLAGGAFYRVAIWPRGKKPEFNINFVPWDRRARKPIPNEIAIFTVLRHSTGDGCYRGETPKALIRMWPRVAKGKPVFELRLEAKPQKETN
jgi:hypothetical protein